jgi:TIGR02217 family protein
MPTAFVEQRFNVDISYGSKGGPSFNTTVFEATSGYEQRNVNWSQARCVYDVSQGIRDKADMEEILEFFYAMRGKATGFRFKDWSDYQLTQELIGTGDGTAVAFQIKKTYSANGSAPYVRDIRKIVTPGTDVPFAVYVNGALKTLTTDYTIDLNTGIITFTTAPANAATIQVTCQFDVPVRFDTDVMSITEEAWNLETWDDIPLVEIKTAA